jgi:hypothetical protein
MNVGEALSGTARIGLVTAPVIYYIKANPQYEAPVADLFDRSDRLTC